MGFVREVVRSIFGGEENYNEYVQYDSNKGGTDKIAREVRDGKETRHVTLHGDGSVNKHEK